jgi:hypothetical protein
VWSGWGLIIGIGTPKGAFQLLFESSAEPRTPAASTRNRSYYSLSFPFLSPHGPP